MLKENDKLVLLISSPSGVGKSTICKMLVGVNRSISFAVTVTTRAPRAGEEHGRDYYFVTKEKYLHMLSEGRFLEHAEVHSNYYGVLYDEVNRLMQNGSDVLFILDWQGAMVMREKINKDQLVTIFLLPPSMSELHKRMMMRNADEKEVMRNRLLGAKTEISHCMSYDYVLINDQIDGTLAKIMSIYEASKIRLEKLLAKNLMEKLMQEEC